MSLVVSIPLIISSQSPQWFLVSRQKTILLMNTTWHLKHFPYISLAYDVSSANLDSAVESGQDDSVQKQNTVQHITDMRLLKTSCSCGNRETHMNIGHRSFLPKLWHHTFLSPVCYCDFSMSCHHCRRCYYTDVYKRRSLGKDDFITSDCEISSNSNNTSDQYPNSAENNQGGIFSSKCTDLIWF